MLDFVTLAALLTNNPWEQSLDIYCFTEVTVAVHGGGVACYSNICGGIVQRQLQTAENPQRWHLLSMRSCHCQIAPTCKRCIANQPSMNVFPICTPEDLLQLNIIANVCAPRIIYVKPSSAQTSTLYVEETAGSIAADAWALQWYQQCCCKV